MNCERNICYQQEYNGGCDTCPCNRTAKEAIENLKKLKSFHNGSYGSSIRMAIEALEKQVPKKPLDDFSTRAIYDNDGNYLDQLNTMTFECPICNNILASGEISVTDCDNIYYCEKCGQAMDWEGIE